jgi:hypothetical protein
MNGSLSWLETRRGMFHSRDSFLSRPIQRNLHYQYGPSGLSWPRIQYALGGMKTGVVRMEDQLSLWLVPEVRCAFRELYKHK